MPVEFEITHLQRDSWLHISKPMAPLLSPSPALTAEKGAQTQQS